MKKTLLCLLVFSGCIHRYEIEDRVADLERRGELIRRAANAEVHASTGVQTSQTIDVALSKATDETEKSIQKSARGVFELKKNGGFVIADVNPAKRACKKRFNKELDNYNAYYWPLIGGSVGSLMLATGTAVATATNQKASRNDDVALLNKSENWFIGLSIGSGLLGGLTGLTVNVRDDNAKDAENAGAMYEAVVRGDKVNDLDLIKVCGKEASPD